MIKSHFFSKVINLKSSNETIVRLFFQEENDKIVPQIDLVEMTIKSRIVNQKAFKIFPKMEEDSLNNTKGLKAF